MDLRTFSDRQKKEYYGAFSKLSFTVNGFESGKLFEVLTNVSTAVTFFVMVSVKEVAS